ncbi:MAG: tRNA (N6-threonylcarbamoyladenosine(37)-N6)-methyltransferase TrmO [Clostridiales bacterium]|nr:tRNA (N6-threonylcarbamoyladenosine(37)-N6)-methyltransferase TrmO [Clostridiales bacterium]
MKIIARIHTDFPEKFGLPRQSGLVKALEGLIVFEPEYRVAEALRGINGFSHLWLLWGFSRSQRDSWSPTVRPPRLGGDRRMGVFATRSPFRPNPIGLSCVKLQEVVHHPEWGLCLRVSGIDLMDQSPLYDIKPYLPYADCIPDATGGFAEDGPPPLLQVEIPSKWLMLIPASHHQALQDVLAQDPRPAYQEDPERVYGFVFAGFNVRFRVEGSTARVCEITPLSSSNRETP